MIWNEVRMINDVKWGWFKVPVKVEQINAYLFSDTNKISAQVVEEVGEKSSQRSYFPTFNIGFCHVFLIKRSESNLS